MLEFKSNQFSWNGRTASAEAAELGLPVTARSPRNFAITSCLTGVRREFYRASAFVNDAQVYYTMDKLPEIMITVYND